jgi:hypothetical protein
MFPVLLLLLRALQLLLSCCEAASGMLPVLQLLLG